MGAHLSNRLISKHISALFIRFTANWLEKGKHIANLLNCEYDAPTMFCVLLIN